MSLENTGMVVVTANMVETRRISIQKTKHDVGGRLAGWALTETYHKSGIAYKSPTYKSMEVKGDKLYVRIEDAAGTGC